MMRFLLDCLRPGRSRSNCARENSVELQTKETKDAPNDNEIKELDDVVAMEEGALQRDRATCQGSQQALESLAKRKAQLKEEIEKIQEQRKQQGQLLLSLQEEKEEMEQMVQEYDAELVRAKDELKHLQEEINRTRAQVEDAHGRMGPLKHSIGETYQEISEAKQRLGGLITEMMAIETCAHEMTSHQEDSTAEDLDHSLGEEEGDEGCSDVYERESPCKSSSVEKELQKLEENIPERLHHSAENLKSSGSSSFTEITLTEFKEADVSPGSITPQHTCSPDLEEEDFEIVQSLMIKPVTQSTTNKEFDFYHPDPFVAHDVFEDERFPKVDMTEFLYEDPFKGTDPFASDNMFVESANSPPEESDALKSTRPPQIQDDAGEAKRADLRNVSAKTNYSQSVDSGMFEQNVLELNEPETPVRSKNCPQVRPEIETKACVDTEIEDGGRFDPIVCEVGNIPESESSNASTVDSSFDGDFNTEQPDEDLEVEAEPSYVRRNRALFGLQRIDTSSYTSFPLSPEICPSEPQFPPADDKEAPVKLPTVFISDTECLETEDHIHPADSAQLSQDSSDHDSLFPAPKEDHFGDSNIESQSAECSEADAYDHKFGDIYFFTVRLDPGSPDASPVSAGGSQKKKSESDPASPESVGAYELDGASSDYDNVNQESFDGHAEESLEYDESEIRTEKGTDLEPDEPVESTNPEHEEHFERSAEHSMLTLEFHGSENADKVAPCVEGAYLKACGTDPVVQYLISPVSGDPGMFATDGYKLCTRNPFSFDTGSVDLCNSAETCPVMESESCNVELGCVSILHPISINKKVSAFEVKNSIISDSGRLDSGYHEFTGLDPFSPAGTDSHLGPGSSTLNAEVLSPENSDPQVCDPFSPESNDTVFESQCGTFHTEDSNPSCTESDIFKGSRFDPFDLVPDYNAQCNTDSPVSEFAQNDSASNEETRSSSWDSGVSHSPQMNSDFAPNRDYPHHVPESNLVNTDAKNRCLTDSLFDLESSSINSSLNHKVDQMTVQEKNSPVNVTAMEDLAEIDFFCSELSKMVASRSSDSVQQSVTEMLFGCNPDTAKFYPWDLGDSSVIGDQPSSPDVDFGYSEKPSLL